MAFIRFNSPKALCKYVNFQRPSAVVCYVHSQLAQTAALPSKVQEANGLCSNQVYQERNVELRIRDIHPVGHTCAVQLSTFKKEGAFVYHPVNVKKDDLQLSTLSMQISFQELCVQNVLNDRIQLALMAWNHERLTEKLLLQHGVERKTWQMYLERQDRRGTSSSKENIRYRKELSCPQTIAFSNLKMNSWKSKEENVTEGPDANQLENVFTVLSDELPKFFCEAVNFDIYHKNITFVNDITGITTRGLFLYKSVICTMRWTLLLSNTDLNMEILKITKHSDDNTVKVRWRIKGESRLRAWFNRRSKVPDGERYRYLDGFSVFGVGPDGFIHCHKLHKVMPSSPKQKESPLWVLNYLAVLGLLNERKTGEALGMFECQSTDKGLDNGLPDNDTHPIPC